MQRKYLYRLDSGLQIDLNIHSAPYVCSILDRDSLEFEGNTHTQGHS